VNRIHDEALLPDAEHIVGWRFEQLVRAGYRREAATCLAERPEVDLHLAADLLAQGCPPETALRILL
jgi:hypothetical protein